MTAFLQTSTAFASAMASGADWRDVGRQILEALESVRTPHDGMNIGFLYATTEMAADLPALLALLRDVTRIQHWYGSTGQGICGSGVSHAGGCAAAAMIGHMQPGSFHGFALDDTGGLPPPLQDWAQDNGMAAALMHGILCAPGAQRLNRMRDSDGVYTIGGFTGAPGGVHIHDGQIAAGTCVLSGVALDTHANVMTATSFGCAQAGRAGRITACEGNMIESIDGVPAAAYLRAAIDQLSLDDGMTAQDDDAQPGARRGHVHAAFPVPGADQQFLMRNITGVDEDAGAISVAHHFAAGDTIQFVYRDRKTATTDLTQVLTRLYARAAGTVGAANMKPRALLYFGCGARLPSGPASGTQDDEARLIAQVFSGVPMAGFYTAAEICNGHVYGYTGVIVLLL